MTTEEVKTPTRRVTWSVGLTIALFGAVTVGSGCGDSEVEEQGEHADVDASAVRDAASPAARELPRLGPSGLESIEIITGGASAADSLPLVVALHGLGDEPENFSKLFEGFEYKARIVIPRGPLKHETGYAWLPPAGPEGVVSRVLKRSADKIAALVDEVRASKATKGKAIVTGFSQGGVLAFVVAARQPERVGAVIPVSGWLPRFAWPDEERFFGNRPILRALSGANDELTKAAELRRGVVKLRMLKLDATVRLYASTSHIISPAMRTDLFAVLSWLVAGTPEPPPCEPCPGSSMDPESCSLCPAGDPAPESETVAATDRSAPAAPRAPGAASEPSPETPEKAAARAGPDVALGKRANTSIRSTGADGERGSLSRQEIQQTFRRNMASIRFCHERQLETHPDLAGRVSIRFVIAADGTVPSAQIATSTLGNDSVAECVRRAVTRVRFPRPEGGGAVTVTYPFMFASADQ